MIKDEIKRLRSARQTWYNQVKNEDFAQKQNLREQMTSRTSRNKDQHFSSLPKSPPKFDKPIKERPTTAGQLTSRSRRMQSSSRKKLTLGQNTHFQDDKRKGSEWWVFQPHVSTIPHSQFSTDKRNYALSKQFDQKNIDYKKMKKEEKHQHKQEKVDLEVCNIKSHFHVFFDKQVQHIKNGKKYKSTFGRGSQPKLNLGGPSTTSLLENASQQNPQQEQQQDPGYALKKLMERFKREKEQEREKEIAKAELRTRRQNELNGMNTVQKKLYASKSQKYMTQQHQCSKKQISEYVNTQKQEFQLKQKPQQKVSTKKVALERQQTLGYFGIAGQIQPFERNEIAKSPESAPPEQQGYTKADIMHMKMKQALKSRVKIYTGMIKFINQKKGLLQQSTSASGKVHTFKRQVSNQHEGFINMMPTLEEKNHKRTQEQAEKIKMLFSQGMNKQVNQQFKNVVKEDVRHCGHVGIGDLRCLKDKWKTLYVDAIKEDQQENDNKLNKLLKNLKIIAQNQIDTVAKVQKTVGTYNDAQEQFEHKCDEKATQNFAGVIKPKRKQDECHHDHI